MEPLPAERYLFRLRLLSPARFPFLHGGAVRGLLSRALEQHQLPDGLLPAVCESGHIHYTEGDPYHLGVTLLGEDRKLLEALEAGLRRVGTGRQRGRGTASGLLAGFEVEGVEAVPLPDFGAQRQGLANGGPLELRFVTPLRLTRPEAERRKGASYFDRQYFGVAPFLDRLWRRAFQLRHGRFPNREERDEDRPPLPETATADPGRLEWLDLPAPGRQGQRRTLGGVVGPVVFEGVPEPWHELLLEGQLTHAGASTAWGFGRYRLPGGGEDPFRPARRFLDEVAEAGRLSVAFDHVLAKSGAAGVDGETPVEFDELRDERVLEIAGQLKNGTYKPAALLGVVMREDDGDLRPLAIPTVRERAVQRAASQALGPSVDELLEDCSYAYRKGFSRSGAAQAVQRAYEDGYRFVLDADIRACFDSVDWQRLFAKLHALFPAEPLVPLLEEWVQAPVSFDGRTIVRKRGLPQGSPVSPLLANLFLDELDESLVDQGFRLIRYADDFVILCRSLEDAERAREEAREALGLLDLELHEDKTDIRSLDQGFSYLGYLFCRSLALESRGKDEETVDDGPMEPEDVPQASWLAQVPFRRLRQLVDRGADEGEGRLELVPLVSSQRASLGLTRPLYVTSPEARLHLSGDTLEIDSGDEEPRNVPLRSLSHLVFLGRSRATVPLLSSLARFGVPSFFCYPSGELFATFGPWQPEWPVWLEQARALTEEDRSVAFAREVVSAKLHNQATIVVRFDWGQAVADELRDLARSARNKTEVDTLRGLEGRGAAVYFQALAEHLPEEWGFPGRRKRPAPDPINALLSYGYTLQLHHITTALVVQGLNPRAGFFHQGRGEHPALGSDLQEEVRWLVDALVWSMVRRREVQPDDFTASPDGRYPCLLTPEFRKKYVEAFERRLHTRFTPPGEEEALSYREFLARQAAAVKAWIQGSAATYRPLRLEA